MNILKDEVLMHSIRPIYFSYHNESKNKVSIYKIIRIKQLRISTEAAIFGERLLYGLV